MPRKIRQYTVEEKVKVVEWLRRNANNVSKTTREFDVDRKRVRESVNVTKDMTTFR